MSFITEAAIALAITLAPGKDWMDLSYPAETVEGREARVGMIGLATDHVAQLATCSGEFAPKECKPFWPGTRRELIVILQLQTWYETKMLKRLHEGKCMPLECDAYKTPTGATVHRARGLWQIQQSALVPTRVWRQLQGTDYRSTMLQAYMAAVVLSRARNACAQKGNWVAPTISSYATGYTCAWRGARGRAKTYNRLYARFKALEDERRKGERGASDALDPSGARAESTAR